jgi:hypothetical protein
LKEIVSTTMFRDNLQFKGNLQSKTYGIVWIKGQLANYKQHSPSAPNVRRRPGYKRWTALYALLPALFHSDAHINKWVKFQGWHAS